jgi:membrane associated rhomboid family serine protease
MTPAPVGHHCPVCVAEGRKETRRIKAAIPRPRSVTTAILAINVGVFVLGMIAGATTGQRGSFLRAGAMVPLLVAQGEWWRLLTAMFLHVSTVHLLLNSLALYMFGALVESSLGRARFVAVYLITGFVGSATSYAFGNPVIAAAGASGAIFGLLGAWLAFNLRRRSLSLARSNVQGALLLIGINLVFGFVVPGIDWLAHVGGLVAGIAAGYAAEGIGRRSSSGLSQVVGLAAVALVGVVLTVWRTSALLG